MLLLVSPAVLFCQSLDSINFDSLRVEIEKKWSKKFYNEMYPDYSGTYDYVINDEKTNLTFKVDSVEIRVSAINKKGKVVWETDPWKDNKLPIYRHNRPVIRGFGLVTIDTEYLNVDEKWAKGKEVIFINYSNSQFGYLDKMTGEFLFAGQD